MANPFDPSLLAPPPAPVQPAPPSSAEIAFQNDRDYHAEAAFQNVAQGLLLGGGVLQDSATPRGLVRIGRNLLTEGEHAASARAGADLLGEAPQKSADKSKTADDIARRGPDDIGVRYLRDNGPKLVQRLATKQAAAAQVLLDTYGELSKLRPSPEQLADAIPDNRGDQARWVTHVRQGLLATLGDTPVPKDLKARVRDLGDGTDPVRWFTAASEIGDELAKARVAAGRAPPRAEQELAAQLSPGGPLEPPVDHTAAIDRARQLIVDGLGQQTVWGDAAVSEVQRSEAYARRAADHISAFEDAFTSQVGKAKKADPEKFAAFLENASPDARRALTDTMEAARATADAAHRFGRPDDARRIMSALDALDRTGSQAQAVQAARGDVSRETAGEGGANDALAFLAGGDGASSLVDGPQAARAGVFRALQGFAQEAEQGVELGVHTLLNGASRSYDDLGDHPDPAAAASGVTAANFQATRDHLVKMSSDARYFGEVMGASFGRLPEAAPEVFRALVQQTSRAVTYLASVAPGGKESGPFGRTFPVSEDDLWDFQQRAAGAMDPTYIRRGLTSGTLTSQAMAGFQEAQPTRYRRLQMSVFSRLQQLDKMGVAVPEQAREQLDTLLDLDGGGEVAMSWHVADQVQRAIQVHAQQLQDRKLNAQDSAQAATRTSGALSTLGNGASALART